MRYIRNLIFSIIRRHCSWSSLRRLPNCSTIIKKGASIRYIVFFLGVWTTAKLPILVYEFSSFGATFTLIHIGFGLVFFYIMGIIFERFYDQEELLRYDVTEEM
ncbi:hypothetical protein FPL02_07510 [Bacillus paranthracis]|nr:hypothetical protein FPL02_07510 [Bacillus paranthracis]